MNYIDCQKNTGSIPHLDPELESIFAEMKKQAADIPAPTKGDWKSIREGGNTAMKTWGQLIPNYGDVSRETFNCFSLDGTSIELRWYKKQLEQSQAAVVYVHGGGMILGDLDNYDNFVAGYVSNTGVPFLAVQYRLAPEVKGDTPVQDVFAALIWLRENSENLGIHFDRIAIMGDSAGGGIAAGTAILARDRGICLSQQILIYPMLDDRNTKINPLLERFATWSYDSNYTGWWALIGDDIGTDKVPVTVAPARLQDFTGLPTAYIEVGDLDIFRDEDICYAQRLLAAGISVELHVLKGLPHGFDRFAPEITISKIAMQNRFRIINSL